MLKMKKLGNLFRSGSPSETTIDPMTNAVGMIQEAERRAQKSKSVTDMLMVSTQWIAVFQFLQESQRQQAAQTPVGFVGGQDAGHTD